MNQSKGARIVSSTRKQNVVTAMDLVFQKEASRMIEQLLDIWKTEGYKEVVALEISSPGSLPLLAVRLRRIPDGPVTLFFRVVLTQDTVEAMAAAGPENYDGKIWDYQLAVPMGSENLENLKEWSYLLTGSEMLVGATEGNGRFTMKMDHLNGIVPDGDMAGIWTVWDWSGKVQTLQQANARIEKWRDEVKLKPYGGDLGGF
jgi:hypothetical protein